MRLIDLPAYTTIHIPAFCAGFVPHIVNGLADGIFVAAQGQFQLKGLLVVPERFTKRNPAEQDILTPVFNLSSRQIRIRRGEIVSQLLCFDKETQWLKRSSR